MKKYYFMNLHVFTLFMSSQNLILRLELTAVSYSLFDFLTHFCSNVLKSQIQTDVMGT